MAIKKKTLKKQLIKKAKTEKVKQPITEKEANKLDKKVKKLLSRVNKNDKYDNVSLLAGLFD